MKKHLLVAVAVILAFGLAACTGPLSSKTNRLHMQQISLGMTEAQVVEVMGEPAFKDLFQAGDLNRQTWWYFTNEMGGKAFAGSVSYYTVTRQDCTPLVFRDGVLVASGRYEKLVY